MIGRLWRSGHGGALLRYTLIGTLAFCVDFAITLALATRWHYLVANTVAFIVANLLQFILVHRWVFRRSFEGDSLSRFYSGTLTISFLGLACSNALVFVGVDLLAMPLAVAKAASAVIVLFFNYSLRVAILYRPTPSER
jgi:putative flippase GtrA